MVDTNPQAGLEKVAEIRAIGSGQKIRADTGAGGSGLTIVAKSGITPDSGKGNLDAVALVATKKTPSTLAVEGVASVTSFKSAMEIAGKLHQVSSFIIWLRQDMPSSSPQVS
jgi:hypothetical protein